MDDGTLILNFLRNMPETTEIALRAAVYARVSTEEQREGQTIDSQVAEAERFAQEKHWRIVGVYKDDGWSGGVMERPELDRLRDDAQKGVFDAVIVNDVDRLARDVAHLGVIKRDLEKKGVRVIFRKLPSEVSPTYNLMVNILGSFAEFERELISDRTRRGRRHKVEVRQQYLGSKTSYGYRWLPIDRAAGNPGLLEIIPEEATVVRQMFEWVDHEGLSARKVLHRLNDLRIRPRMGAMCWAKSSVLRILRNEMYAGVWYYNKYRGCEPQNPVKKGQYRRMAKSSNRLRPRSEWMPVRLPEHLGVVPRPQWERVQFQLAQNYAFSPRNEKHCYLLKGLVRCGGCGARLVGDPDKGRFSYRCIARCKRVPLVREERLNAAAKQAVTKLLTNPSVILRPLREIDERAAQDTSQTRTKQWQASIQVRRLDGEEQRILKAYRSGVISPSQLARELEEIKAQRAAFTLDLMPAPEISPKAVEGAVREYCAEAAANLAAFTFSQWQSLLRTVIETIIFNRDHIVVRGRIPAPDVTTGPKIELSSPIPLPHYDGAGGAGLGEVTTGGHEVGAA